jgi:hypothetical protein
MKRIVLILVLLPFMAVSANAQSFMRGDANHDGNIDISDLVVIVNRVLEGNPTSYRLCPDNKHPHLIDLGLPSGILWSCCNVDAKTPQSYGGYYAWGETKQKSYYDWSNYSHCDGTEETCHDLGGYIGGSVNDVAHTKWGGKWMTPSNTAWDEIDENCTYEWTTVNGVKGAKLTSKINGASIFLPAAGWRWQSDTSDVGVSAAYWASVQNDRNLSQAHNIYFYSDHFIAGVISSLAYGRSIRPVQDETSCDVNADGNIDISDVVKTVNMILSGAYVTCPDAHHPHKIDLGLPSGTLWSCCNVGTTIPQSSGDAFAWGEIRVKYYYDNTTYTHCDDQDMEKCHDIGSSIIGTKYDAATMKWGSSWQMPSFNQADELIKQCTSEWIQLDGINGFKFTGPNGKSIFFPAAGLAYQDGYYNYDKSGWYWLGDNTTQVSPYGFVLNFRENGTAQLGRYYRECGLYIRPVAK